jgi:hypothetical protein
MAGGAEKTEAQGRDVWQDGMGVHVLEYLICQDDFDRNFAFIITFTSHIANS